jgi:DNA-binding IclR family transcriptional regulator
VLAALDPTRLRRILARPLERRASATIADPCELQRELEGVRRQGYAVIIDELEDGLASVSVPILGADRRLLGTVAVTGPSFRFDVVRRRAAPSRRSRPGSAATDRDSPYHDAVSTR